MWKRKISLLLVLSFCSSWVFSQQEPDWESAYNEIDNIEQKSVDLTQKLESSQTALESAIDSLKKSQQLSEQQQAALENVSKEAKALQTQRDALERSSKRWKTATIVLGGVTISLTATLALILLLKK